jgi:phosphohistidine phosphatase
MELLLVRHAIAFDRDLRRWRDDRKRPLSPRGVARAHKAARGLWRFTPAPTQLLASPLLRTYQTAVILHESADWPKPDTCEELEPGRPPDEFLGLLAESDVASTAAVGHAPDLGVLLASCLGGAQTAFEFRKMGVALVSFRGRARAGAGQLVWFVPPRLLRAVG